MGRGEGRFVSSRLESDACLLFSPASHRQLLSDLEKFRLLICGYKPDLGRLDI